MSNWQKNYRFIIELRSFQCWHAKENEKYRGRRFRGAGQTITDCLLEDAVHNEHC